MWLFSRVLNTPWLVNRFLRNIRHQQDFLRKHLGEILEDAEKNSDGSLDSADFKKIYTYYGLAVPAILGEEIAMLTGRPMTERERLALSYQGAMTGLFDDFFDKHEMSEDRLLNFVENPGSINGNNSSERLFLHLFRKSLDLSHHPAQTIEYLRRVYLAQVESLQQNQPGLSREDIKKITIEKGGVSVLFYRSVFEREMIGKEENAFYRMGGLMQFGNDIFDVYKDSLQDIHTLMTTTRKVDLVRREFREMQAEAFGSFFATAYGWTATRRFLDMVELSLCARCYVCLDQLEKLEALNAGIFDPKKHSRAELICDLDNLKNKWRSIRYFWKGKRKFSLSHSQGARTP